MFAGGEGSSSLTRHIQQKMFDNQKELQTRNQCRSILLDMVLLYHTHCKCKLTVTAS